MIRKLVVYQSGEVIQEVELQSRILLGRSSDCAIRLDDLAVSRCHAALIPTPEGVEIENRSEFAPIVMHGSEVSRTVVQVGETIAIGPYEIEVLGTPADSLAPSIKEEPVEVVTSDSLVSEHFENDTAQEDVPSAEVTEEKKVDLNDLDSEIALDLTEPEESSVGGEEIVFESTQAMGEELVKDQEEEVLDLSEFDDGDSVVARLSDSPLESEGEQEKRIEMDPTALVDINAVADGLPEVFTDSEDQAEGEVSLLDLSEGPVASSEDESVLELNPDLDDDLSSVGSVQDENSSSDFDFQLGALEDEDFSTNSDEGDERENSISNLFDSSIPPAFKDQDHTQSAMDFASSEDESSSFSVPNLGGSEPSETSLNVPDLVLGGEPAGTEESVTGQLGVLEATPTGNLSLEITNSDPGSGPTNTTGSTKLTGAGRVRVCLVLHSPDGNLEEYEIRTPEIVIGRSKNCDITIEDKKISRRNTTIRRDGLDFYIKDLDSVNGTFVNGARTEEQKLTGNDRISIGDSEFDFKVINVDYEQNQGLYSEESSLTETSLPYGQSVPKSVSPPLPSLEMTSSLSSEYIPQPPAQPMGLLSSLPESLQSSPKVQSWIGKYRDLPKRKRYIYLATLLVLVWVGLDELFPERPEATRKIAAESKSDVKNFASLSKKDQKFIKDQYKVGYDFYREKNFDRSLFEIRKIFQLLPDYKAAREIERYAIEGKKRLERNELDRKRRLEEEQIERRVAELEKKIREQMEDKKYGQLELLFSEIVAIDPENENVAIWRKKVADDRERKAREEEQKKILAEINRNGWKVYQLAIGFKKDGRCIAAIEKLETIPTLGVSDQKLIARSSQGIRDCRSEMVAMVEPILQDAKDYERNGDVKNAFRLYEKATTIDPQNAGALRGIDRIRGVLHELAKVLYTEAVIAESYSDFSEARLKFEEVVETVPTDDVYHERASSKLKKYAPFRGVIRQPASELSSDETT